MLYKKCCYTAPLLPILEHQCFILRSHRLGIELLTCYKLLQMIISIFLYPALINTIKAVIVALFRLLLDVTHHLLLLLLSLTAINSSGIYYANLGGA